MYINGGDGHQLGSGVRWQNKGLEIFEVIPDLRIHDVKPWATERYNSLSNHSHRISMHSRSPILLPLKTESRVFCNIRLPTLLEQSNLAYRAYLVVIPLLFLIISSLFV